MEQGEARLLPECREESQGCAGHEAEDTVTLSSKELERVLGVPLKRRRKSRLASHLGCQLGASGPWALRTTENPRSGAQSHSQGPA